jgi:hypothetical protein
VVIAANWAHQVLYHDLPVETLRVPAVAFLVVTLLLFLAPLAVFAGALARAKVQAGLEYGALVGRHGDLVRKRWILQQPVAHDEVLNAPELGPVADTVSLFEAVKRMRWAPIGRQALGAILLPAALPLVAVFALRIPVQEILMKLLHAVA